jgi:hypothetical protein
MAHFAKLDENNNVIGVHVVNNEVITIDNVESEQAGINFLTELHGHTLWKQTSYNKTFHKNYAGVGYIWDPNFGEDGAFYPPQPFPSWTLDQNAKWQPPVAYPNDGVIYDWDEESLSWRPINFN